MVKGSKFRESHVLRILSQREEGEREDKRRRILAKTTETPAG
jgi:hypothetical protein